MSNDILTSLLSDYEQKKRKAEINFEHQKVELYKKIPRLQEIEDELNSVAINETKNILFGNSSSLENLHQKIESLKEERKKILSKNNLSINDLQPKYECCLCKDTGYIKSGTSATVMCSCLKQKLLNISYNKSNMTNLSKENFENFNQNIFSNEISTNFNISPKQNTVLKEVTPEDFMFAGADAFSRQVVKMMNDKLIAPYGMLVEKDKEIERLNRLIGRLQNEIEELKKGSAQTENPVECANAV